MRLLSSFALTCLLVCVWGCGDDGASESCKPDAAPEACSCDAGGQGLSVCNADGSLTCVCGGGAAGSSGSGGNSGSGGGGSSGSSATDDGGAGDDDSGTGSSAADGGDAATSGATDAGQDAATAAAPAYDGPCKTDKDCRGNEVCEGAGSFSYCSAVCHEAADCPAAPDGNATVVCVGGTLITEGTCALSCGLVTGDCPAGMVCSDLLILPGTCVWDNTI